MQFRTIIDVSKSLMPPLKHDDSVLLLGSCFSDNMGGKLRNAMIDATINPFGTTYNPLSLLKSIEFLSGNRDVESCDLFQANGMWNHFMFHSRFSCPDKPAALQEMNASVERGRKQLRRCSHLFVTLGTSFVYKFDGNDVVNNCHKLPSSRFTRTLCSMGEIEEALGKIATLVHGVNQSAHVIFTVSPIRHLADGLAMNHLSKSLLTVAAHNTIASRSEYCHYFPAYEILNDDLRDYRFYAADMAHPSEVAIDYVWEQFKTAFFEPAERDKAEQCERLSKMLAHRPLSRDPETVEQFRQKQAKALADMAARFPHIAKLDYLTSYITRQES